MRIVYPLMWSRLEREASRQQSISTAAALARRGLEVTVLMPWGAGDPALTAAELGDYFAAPGDLRLVQRRSRWAGTALAPSLMWMRQLFRDPEVLGADVLYSRIPAMLALGFLSPRPFVGDHYRPWPDQLSFIRPLVRATGRHRNCVGLIAHSRFAADAYRRAGVPDDRLLVAHNGVDAPAETPPDREQARRLLQLPKAQPIVVYAGRIGRDKGLNRVASLARARPQVLFLLVGADRRSDAAESFGELVNVRLVPWQTPAALPAWLAAADVLLLPPSRAPLERHGNCVLPMKLFAYLAAGRPILAPALPDVGELLVDGENALLVPPDDTAAAAEALDRLLGDPALAERLGGAGARLAEGFTWDARAAWIAEFLERRLAQRSLYRSTVPPVSTASAGAAQAPSAAGK